MTRTEISEALNIATVRLDLVKTAWRKGFEATPKEINAMKREAGILIQMLGSIVTTEAMDEREELGL